MTFDWNHFLLFANRLRSLVEEGADFRAADANEIPESIRRSLISRGYYSIFNQSLDYAIEKRLDYLLLWERSLLMRGKRLFGDASDLEEHAIRISGLSRRQIQERFEKPGGINSHKLVSEAFEVPSDEDMMIVQQCLDNLRKMRNDSDYDPLLQCTSKQVKDALDYINKANTSLEKLRRPPAAPPAQPKAPSN